MKDDKISLRSFYFKESYICTNNDDEFVIIERIGTLLKDYYERI